MEHPNRGRDFADIAHTQQEIYRANFLEHGDTPRGVFWNDAATQELRFERLLHPILNHLRPVQQLEVHEVGCGTCALHAYLAARGVDHVYSGTEIVPEMAEQARTKFPSIDVRAENFLGAEGSAHDFLVLSGVFNLRQGADSESWSEYVEQVVLKMFAQCRHGIAFNFLTSDITVPPNPQLHYIDPRQMLEFCGANLSRFVQLDQAYPLFECTLIAFKPQFLKERHPENSFDKYFGTQDV